MSKGESKNKKESNIPVVIKFLNRYAELIIVASVALLSVILLASIEQELLTTISILLLLLLVGATLYQFTRRLDDENLSAIFRLAYGFVVFTLASAAYLFFIVSEPKFFGKAAMNYLDCDGPKKLQCSGETPYSYAVGIFPGCDYTPERFTKKHILKSENDEKIKEVLERKQMSGIPYHSFCDTIAPQWVLSIGGSVSQCYIDGSCSKVKGESFRSKSQLKIQLLDEKSALGELQKKIAEKKKLESIIAATSRLYTDKINRLQNKLKTIFSPDTELEISEKIKLHKRKIALLDQEINNYPEDPILAQSFTHPITGGIVVPVYFVVLALLGALVGLMRKVPEFQRRASENYRENYDNSPEHLRDQYNPPITPDEGREFVIFQILQVISAPIIAIVAYAWIDPGDKATSVVLAFAAGFSSEIFLIAVRKVTETVIARGIPKYTPRKAFNASPTSTSESNSSVNLDLNKFSPRGPINSTKPRFSMMKYVYQIGDRVVLTKKLAIFLPGTQGIVTDIDSNNYITVRTTKDHSGEQVEFTLPPQQADYFKPYDQTTETNKEGPVG